MLIVLTLIEHNNTCDCKITFGGDGVSYIDKNEFADPDGNVCDDESIGNHGSYTCEYHILCEDQHLWKDKMAWTSNALFKAISAIFLMMRHTFNKIGEVLGCGIIHAVYFLRLKYCASSENNSLSTAWGWNFHRIAKHL